MKGSSVRSRLLVKSASSTRKMTYSDKSLKSPRSGSGVGTRASLESLDTITVNVMGLEMPNYEQLAPYVVKVTYMRQNILITTVTPTNISERNYNRILGSGTFSFNPKNYENMCLMADKPLIVTIWPMDANSGAPPRWRRSSTPPMPARSHTHPQRSGSSPRSPKLRSPGNKSSHSSSTDESESILMGASYCNVDILPLLLDETSLFVRKRLEPIITPSVLKQKSWNNLPLVTMKVIIARHPDLAYQHHILKKANVLKITMVGAYNLPIPYNNRYTYTAFTKLPQHKEYERNRAFYVGQKIPRRFDEYSFYPDWETQKAAHAFSKADDKLVYSPADVINPTNIDLKYYQRGVPRLYTAAWMTFHRTLLIDNELKIFEHEIFKLKWPFELHIQNEYFEGYSFMGFADLQKLLYPGVDSVHVVVPLIWYSVDEIMKQSHCDPFHPKVTLRTSSLHAPEHHKQPTGSDENPAFIVVAVSLAKPLNRAVIPPVITINEISGMLGDLKKLNPIRECTGRGQQKINWATVVRNAAAKLRALPQCGQADYCTFIRQFSETRTRVEIMTSFCEEAALYVNNNLIAQNFLHSADLYEELLLLAHVCLVNEAVETLIPAVKDRPENPTLRAARQARQMQDVSHATELFLLHTKEKASDSNNWRELATCLQDVNTDWAAVCIDKSLRLNIRHPISLLIKTGMIYEENPDDAEQFFFVLLSWFPFWATMLTIAYVYFDSREFYTLADNILSFFREIRRKDMVEEPRYARAWDCELGDWWDASPLLPGMSHYYDAADLLIRLRLLKLAELCLAKSLLESGDSVTYYHLLALIFRLRGNTEEALCHLQTGIDKFGDVVYLKTLESECWYKQQNFNNAKKAFENTRPLGSFSIILSTTFTTVQRKRSLVVDLVRRQPSAYAWMALADIWLKHESGRWVTGVVTTSIEEEAVKSAIACAEQALLCDRRCERAWALIADHTHPSARRKLCRQMAIACGHIYSDELSLLEEFDTPSKQTLCHELGWKLPTCDREPIYFN